MCQQNKQTKTMRTFETNKQYNGSGYAGEVTFTVIKRTAKFITVVTQGGTTFKTKIRDYYKDAESISFGAWIANA